MTADQIKDAITAALPCEHIQVDGDGHHWFAVIVSTAFEGKRAIARHQMVYGTLDRELASEALHALSMKTMTPTEWQAVRSG